MICPIRIVLIFPDFSYFSAMNSNDILMEEWP